jgi:hypothetical protein
MQAYGTKNAASARAAWARLLAHDSDRTCPHQRQAEIEEARKVEIAFDRDRYIRALAKMLRTRRPFRATAPWALSPPLGPSP